MKKIGLLLASLMLVACSPQYEQETYPLLPPELSDCKFFNITSGNGSYALVARCPNSATSTTYKSGKTTRRNVVVDGEQQ